MESARRVVELQVAPPVQERIETLAERANEGTLTHDERSEYEALIKRNRFYLDTQAQSSAAFGPERSVAKMDATTRDLVRLRAGERCEYCRLHRQHSELVHHIEHIVAKQHGGSMIRAVWRCHAIAAICTRFRT